MNELLPILEKHNLNLTQLRQYEKQMPPERKALHLAVCEILQQPKMNVSKLAKILNVDRGKIYIMLYGKDVDYLPQRYSDFEDAEIRNNYKKMTYKELADKIGRAENGVWRRAKKLGLRKTPIPRQPQTDRNFPF